MLCAALQQEIICERKCPISVAMDASNEGHVLQLADLLGWRLHDHAVAEHTPRHAVKVEMRGLACAPRAAPERDDGEPPSRRLGRVRFHEGCAHIAHVRQVDLIRRMVHLLVAKQAAPVDELVHLKLDLAQPLCLR